MPTLRSKMSARVLPRSLNVLRGKARESAQATDPATVELFALRTLLAKCRESTEKIQRRHFAAGGEICRLYRNGMASLSVACSHFVRAALEMLGSEDDGETNHAEDHLGVSNAAERLSGEL